MDYTMPFSFILTIYLFISSFTYTFIYLSLYKFFSSSFVHHSSSVPRYFIPCHLPSEWPYGHPILLWHLPYLSR